MAVSYPHKCPLPPLLSLTAPVTAALASLSAHFLTEGASHFATCHWPLLSILTSAPFRDETQGSISKQRMQACYYTSDTPE